LQNKLKELTATSVTAGETAASEISQSTAKFAEVCFVLLVAALTLSYCEQERASLEAALEVERTKRTEVEKEQEDLLVLLDELSNKRAGDKQRMKEQGMEVSEDEDDEEEDGEEEEED
jgi:intracellular protein transport protein USO1